jgi:Leucine-rich repeat (LRR) protein
MADFSNNTLIGDASWELHHVVLATGISTILIASGTSNSTCQFALDGTCTTNCYVKDGHLKEEYTQSPITADLSLNPTPSPTWKRTRRPTTPAPSIYLPQDKVSFGSARWKRLESIILTASPDSASALDDNDSPQYTALVWLYNSVTKLPDRRILLRWILASFYFGLNGDDWFNKKGWLSANNNECDWHGIMCLDGVVTQISLEENRMVGEIVPELALLKDSLYYLSLGNNYDTPEVERNVIATPIPSFLGDMLHLTYLNLEGIGLTSTIPNALFTRWTRLESLYMNDNDITGTLPSSIANLQSIKVLWMGGNNLGGSIISEIGQLTTLVDLSLESNFREDKAGKRGFMTALPASLAQLTNLEMLDLSDNALSGSIPAQLGDLISLRRLDLSNNFFENQLPTAIGRLQMLEELDISFNWCVKIALLSAIYVLQTSHLVLYSLGCPRQYQRNTEP